MRQICKWKETVIEALQQWYLHVYAELEEIASENSRLKEELNNKVKILEKEKEDGHDWASSSEE
ncbi:hypothetical protein DAPPUDRAFT_262773 [Daphnia pulex]|uniref:Uncharacterized protein n=1 Tax=Daphnia pulex TaxID=6669 RepID=E9HNN4_DAPPU|nr:hypothetical protein DAPPUDRAFT_262773 [Daphnia pulex]|eukprot:EFX66636.1 hypothetical protein DAPPUDRAFT_262773 [Daphnia pulex]